MTHRERLETAWRFAEPDRVPIELVIAPGLHEDPRAERLMALIREHADNFVGVPSPDFGFMGLPTDYTERVIEERAGELKWVERVHETPAGRFTALTYHPADTPTDYLEETLRLHPRRSRTPGQRAAGAGPVGPGSLSADHQW